MAAIPEDIARAQEHIGSVLSVARTAADATYADVVGQGGLMADEIVDLLHQINAPVKEGRPLDGERVARLLTMPVFKQVPQLGEASPSVAGGGLEPTVLVVQAAISEQQNRDHTLKEGASVLSAYQLEEALDSWVLRGRHRPGREDSALSQIARVIDSGSVDALAALHTRLGCCVPVVFGLRMWANHQKRLQALPEEAPAQNDVPVL